MINPEKIWHEHLTDLSTSPVICNHFTLENPKINNINNDGHAMRPNILLRYNVFGSMH